MEAREQKRIEELVMTMGESRLYKLWQIQMGLCDFLARVFDESESESESESKYLWEEKQQAAMRKFCVCAQVDQKAESHWSHWVWMCGCSLVEAERRNPLYCEKLFNTAALTAEMRLSCNRQFFQVIMWTGAIECAEYDYKQHGVPDLRLPNVTLVFRG